MEAGILYHWSHPPGEARGKPKLKRCDLFGGWSYDPTFTTGATTLYVTSCTVEDTSDLNFPSGALPDTYRSKEILFPLPTHTYQPVTGNTPPYVVTLPFWINVAREDPRPAAAILVGVNSVPGIQTVRLPAAPPVGTVVIVKDEGNAAAGNNITIATTDGSVIDGSATYVVNVNRAAISIYFNGAHWFIY